MALVFFGDGHLRLRNPDAKETRDVLQYRARAVTKTVYRAAAVAWRNGVPWEQAEALARTAVARAQRRAGGAKGSAKGGPKGRGKGRGRK